MKTKICTKCGKSKPLEGFAQNVSTKDGRRSRCRECDSEWSRAYYAANRARVLVAQRVYRAANKEKIQAAERAYYMANKERISAHQQIYRVANREKARSNHLQRTYGITLAEYDEMLEAQGGKCAICGKTPEENNRRLDVDHNHDTGVVRGLLCNDCNSGIGRFYDNTSFLHRAADYLRAAQLLVDDNDRM